LREPPDKLIATLASRLPNRDSDIIQEAYRAKKPELMAAIEVARNARIRVSSILAQRDLDMNELRAAFKQAMDSRTRMGELLADTVVDTLGRLSLDARRQLAKQIPSR
jgi:uncharacterized membrane protein